MPDVPQKMLFFLYYSLPYPFFPLDYRKGFIIEANMTHGEIFTQSPITDYVLSLNKIEFQIAW
jgi:hypothetical protein